MPSLVGPALAPGALRVLPQPTLPVTDEFLLRPWDPARDVDAVRRAFDDPDIQFWHTRRLDTDAEARDWLASWGQRWSDERAASWAIAQTGSSTAVGQAGLRTVFLEGAQAQVSYWVLPEARRRGLASRATEAVVQWAFGRVGLQRLSLQHSVRNSASCAVASAAGFDLEGTLRRHMLHADGWHDFHLHARVSPTPGDA